MESITIRPGTASDRLAMNRLWHQTMTWRRAGIGLSEPEALDAARTLDDPDVFTVVAETAGSLVGMVLGRHAKEADGRGAAIPGLCHVSMVAVAPERWGAGIGRRLMVEVLTTARSRGYTRAQLWTQHSNTRARTLYEHLGIIPTGREKRDDAGEPIMHFERALSDDVPREAPG